MMLSKHDDAADNDNDFFYLKQPFYFARKLNFKKSLVSYFVHLNLSLLTSAMAAKKAEIRGGNEQKRPCFIADYNHKMT